jgi:bacterioferritin (cytochrome b1)
VKAIRVLDEAISDIVRHLNELLRADDVGHIKELEQYVKLVTTGIRQYLAAINYRPKTGGAP